MLLGAGTRGKRFALPHARILLHQPFGGVEGQASDIELQAKEILRMRDLLNGMLAADTGQTMERVSKDTDRDFIMTAEEGVSYGLIDEVITARDAVGIEAVGAAVGTGLQPTQPVGLDIGSSLGIGATGQGQKDKGNRRGEVRRRWRPGEVQLLRQVAEAGQEVDRRTGGVHLR